MTGIADGGGRSSGSLKQGLHSQLVKNLKLDPWLGGNTAAADRSTRRGEQIADVAFIAGGSAVAGSAAIRLHGLVHHGSNMLGRVAVGAIGLAGLVYASAGAKNLFQSESPVVPLPPGKFPPAEPKPPTKPKPPSEEPKPKPTPPVQTPPKGPGKLPVHSVRPGEYLSAIAKCYDISWQQLYWQNRKTIGSDPDSLRIGQRLQIPSADLKVPHFIYTPSRTPGVPGNIKICK